MQQRGRKGSKGAAALHVVEKPEPPAELNEDQAREWRAIIDSMRGGWFPRETHIMLVQLCRVKDRLDHIARNLDRWQDEGKTATAAYRAERAAEDELTKTAAVLMTRMRITQQSTMSPTKTNSGQPKVNGRAGLDAERQARLSLGGQEDSSEAA